MFFDFYRYAQDILSDDQPQVTSVITRGSCVITGDVTHINCPHSRSCKIHLVVSDVRKLLYDTSAVNSRR